MVTNLKQKAQQVKQHRRSRYKRACQPIMAKFGCTSMEVAGVVERTFQENRTLKADLAGARVEIEMLEERVKAMRIDLENMASIKE